MSCHAPHCGGAISLMTAGCPAARCAPALPLRAVHGSQAATGRLQAPRGVRRLRARLGVVASASPALGLPVMVNGITGKMGFATAEAAVSRGLHLLPVAFSATRSGERVSCAGVTVELQPYDGAVLERLRLSHPGLVVVDYTHPGSVHTNAQLYARHRVPFVMGTTGGDRGKLLAETEAAGAYAVIAPQMGKQLVAFQAAFEFMASRFPDAFEGYTLSVSEAHQSTKADTSGTAKALVSSFQGLGLEFNVEDIVKVRDEAGQRAMGVPEAHLKGHAYHTYRLTSPDGLVNFEFQHNVCGRSIYAQGTVDAVLFIAARARERAEKTRYDMVDVLSSEYKTA